MNEKTLKDLASRAGWTALQGALGVITAFVADIDPTSESGLFALVVTTVATLLSAAKSFVATKVGNRDSVEFH